MRNMGKWPITSILEAVFNLEVLGLSDQVDPVSLPPPGPIRVKKRKWGPKQICVINEKDKVIF